MSRSASFSPSSVNLWFQEVSWPPPANEIKEKQVLDSIKTLPNLSGVVHIGKAKRQMMDIEFENVLKSSTAKYTSHPFTKGNRIFPAGFGSFLHFYFYFQRAFNPVRLMRKLSGLTSSPKHFRLNQTLNRVGRGRYSRMLTPSWPTQPHQDPLTKCPPEHREPENIKKVTWEKRRETFEYLLDII